MLDRKFLRVCLKSLQLGRLLPLCTDPKKQWCLTPSDSLFQPGNVKSARLVENNYFLGGCAPVCQTERAILCVAKHLK
jgi:hypothetical protein